MSPRAANPVNRIQQAYNDGVLFVHMFEFPMEHMITSVRHAQHTIKNFFDVMNGAPGTSYKCLSDYRHVNATSQGHIGLAATALKSDFPIGLWTDVSRIGLLFDGNDSAHVNPVFVSSQDMYSRVDKTDHDSHVITCTMHDRERFDEVREIQQITQPKGTEFKFDFRISDGANYFRRAREALAKYWEILASIDWNQHHEQLFKDKYNEVALNAHMKGLAGIVVYEPDKLSSAAVKPIYAEVPGFSTKLDVSEYRNRLVSAMHVRDYLCRNYGLDEDDLPILSYDPNREQERLKLADLSILKSIPNIRGT